MVIFQGRFETAKARDLFDGRFYVHPAGFDSVFLQDVINAARYVADVLQTNREILAAFKLDYLVGVAWGASSTQRERRLDLFGFTFEEHQWPGNPEIRPFIFENERYIPNASLFCGDGALLLAVEEGNRRNTVSLEAHMRFPPTLMANGDVGLVERTHH